MNNIIRVPVIISIFIMLGLTFGYLTFKVLSYSRTVEAPSLVNMTLFEANKLLNQAGLYLKIEGEDYDSSIPAGCIIRQDIPAGNKIKEKRAIKVIVSKGPRAYSIPLVINKTQNDAEALLLQNRLKIGKIIYVHSDSIKKGRVVTQKPGPDERLIDYVTLLVSLGPHEYSYFCPDFSGKSLVRAKDLAGKIGLKVQTKGSGNTIRSQDPKPGAIVKTGDKIYLELKEDNVLEWFYDMIKKENAND